MTFQKKKKFKLDPTRAQYLLNYLWRFKGIQLQNSSYFQLLNESVGVLISDYHFIINYTVLFVYEVDK